MTKSELEMLAAGELVKASYLKRTFEFCGHFKNEKMVGIRDTKKNEFRLLPQSYFLKQYSIAHYKKKNFISFPLKNQDVIDYLEINKEVKK